MKSFEEQPKSIEIHKNYSTGIVNIWVNSISLNRMRYLSSAILLIFPTVFTLIKL